ncbi:MAG: cystathionine gamma-synthase family protein [Alphaproteobacteria bacterium]|nr:MAG: cystathionine gamma-synthase family protein [Alphaproteobacteria bacterium]
MSGKDYRRRTIGNHVLRPETQMMGYGYDPHLSEGALKPPVFLTSTFVFESAQHGKDFFDLALGRREPRPGEQPGLIYSRFNNPDLEVLEDRLALWEGGEKAAVFAAGMAAISATMFACLRPGDVIVHSQPLYGGTETMILNFLPQFGIQTVGFHAGEGREAIDDALAVAREMGPVRLLFAETPANPTNGLVDLAHLARRAREMEDQEGGRPLVAVDNTFLGPVWQNPIEQGCDLVLYSMTKYIGGHSDLVGGAVVGAKQHVQPILQLRGMLGMQLDPHSCWMTLRSLETLKVRMERATENAWKVAQFLRDHPKVARVHFLGFLEEGTEEKAIYDRQCKGTGSTFSFEVKGGEAEAFRLLDALQVCKLAVSLGGTETLICHPASTTHSGVPKELRDAAGVTNALIRVSVGIEAAEDLIADLEQALEKV